jgi:L-fucose isomerase-like protein
LEGTTLPPRRPLQGTHGLVAVPNTDVRGLFDALCHEGMPHHVAVVRGHAAQTLRRWARLAHWPLASEQIRNPESGT